MTNDFKISLGGTDDDDIFAASAGSDIVYGFGGDDVFHDSDSNASDSYFGGRGDDLIFTAGGRDYIKGNTGRDTIISNNYGDFEVDGGFGRDTFDFQVSAGHIARLKEIDDEKTIIRVFNDDGELTQKIIVRDVENIDWYMIG